MTQQTTRAALAQALDALESLVFNNPYDGKYGDALAAGRAALLEAQPKLEPLTDEQIDAAVEAWFGAEVEAKGFKTRMRLAIEAAHKIGGLG